MGREDGWDQLVEWDIPQFKVVRMNPRGHASWWILWRPKGVQAPLWRFQRLPASDRLEALQEAVMVVVERKCSVTVREPKGRRWPEKPPPPLTTLKELPAKVAEQEG